MCKPAFVLANHSILAHASLSNARLWQSTEEDHIFIDSDSVWRVWDNGNLFARKRFDALLGEVSVNLANVAEGPIRLLEDVQGLDARIQVRHQLSLIMYASGSEEEAVSLMHDLVAVALHQKNLTENYVVRMYSDS